MRGWRAACLVALVSPAACGPQGAGEQREAEAPKLSELQRLATLDCQCRLAGNDGSRHGKEYSRLTQMLTRQGSATSSVPVSYESDCFPELGENACVLTGGHIPPDGANFICTEEQGIALEELWNDAYAGSASENEADNAVLQRLDEMRVEGKTSVSDEDCA